MNRLTAQSYFTRLDEITQPFARCCILSSDNETLFMRYQTLVDIGTLPQCAEVANKYLQIQDGDIVLTNDPYSGGTILSSPTLVMGIGTRTQKNATPAEILICSRLTLTPHVAAFQTIDEEGLRIPPSPYYLKGEMNSPLTEALKAHPHIQKNFMRSIEEEALKLLQMRQKVKSCMAAGRLDFSKGTVKQYLQLTTQQFLKRLEEIGEGSAQVDFTVSENEVIRLKAEHHDSIFRYDFTGTSTGERMFLTDTATFGTVVGATLSLLFENIPINSGLLSCFDVRAPRGSLLNATFPRSLYLGHTEGVNILANTVTKALSSIHKKQVWAASGVSHCSFELQFKNGKVYYDSLASGVGATEKSSGLSGAFPWRKNNKTGSLEYCERTFPLQFAHSSFRAKSGGEGKNNGGQGVSRALTLLEDAELCWSTLIPAQKAEGLEGGKAGLPAEIILQRKGAVESESLPAFGRMQLLKGDMLTVMSAGGGGYGPA